MRAAPAPVNVECYMVGREEMESYWRDVYGPMIGRALFEAPGEESLDDIRDDLHSDSMLINIAVEGVIQGVAVLQSVRLHDERLLHVHTLTGGGMTTWLGEFVAYLKYLNKALDLDGISLTGRFGWHRVLKNHGFKTRYVMMRHEG